jgi:hypothetical protein
MDMPFVETLEEARHFLRGPVAYAHQMSPWKAPITSWMRPESPSDRANNGHDAGIPVANQGTTAAAAE